MGLETESWSMRIIRQNNLERRYPPDGGVPKTRPINIDELSAEDREFMSQSFLKTSRKEPQPSAGAN